MKTILQTKFLTCLLALMPFLALAEDPLPNIIVIITDQHTGKIMTQRGYNHIDTPGLDKLADEGTLFTKSYVTYPVCTFSRKSMITGLMPHKLDDVETAATSVGKTMKDAGYDTGYFGKWHVGNTHLDELEAWHGFDTYYENYYDGVIYDHSKAFLDETRTKPFFMVTSYNNPHDACELARNISGGDDTYHDGAVEEAMDLAFCPPLPFNYEIPLNEAEGHSARRNQDPGDQHYSSHPTKTWTDTEWRQYLYGYDRLLEKVDSRIEDLIDDLDEKGLLENTVIIYTSDHGDGRAAHKWNQKKSFYEESVNVPFIISWKGKTKAGVVDETTLVSSGLDLYPTILQFAGIDIPESFHGIDLSPAALITPTGTITPRDYVISENVQSVYTGSTGGKFNGRMVVTNEFKYMLFDKGVNREQLYDLTTDPGELAPVTDDPNYQDDIADMRQKLKDWVIEVGDDFDVDTYVAELESNAELDNIKLNGQSITSFSPNTKNYSLFINPVDDVTVEALPFNSASTVTITPPADINGDEQARTATIVVESEDTNESNTYTVVVDFTDESALKPTKDAYVRGGESADTNFGSDINLDVKQGGNVDFFRKAFLTFDVSQFEGASSATLKLYTTTSKAAPVTLYEADNNWDESTITWNNAPVLGTEIATKQIGNIKQYYEWDVTDFVHENAGGMVSFGLYDPSADNSHITFTSKDALGNHPQLVVVPGEATDNTDENEDDENEDDENDDENEVVLSAEPSKQQISIYPNPLNDGMLYVDLPSNDGTQTDISITDMQGKMIYHNQVQNKKSIQIDTNSWLTKGLYVISVRTENTTSIFKLIVR